MLGLPEVQLGNTLVSLDPDPTVSEMHGRALGTFLCLLWEAPCSRGEGVCGCMADSMNKVEHESTGGRCVCRVYSCGINPEWNCSSEMD